MITTNEVQQLLQGGGNVVSTDGTKIGSIGQVYLDDQTSQPEWVTTSTGLFGTSESFVPLEGATVSGNDVVVPFDKDKVKDAPRMGEDGHLSEQEEAELYRYYGLDYGTTSVDTDHTVSDHTVSDHAGTVGHDTSGPTTDTAMTRSEEQLHVGTERREAGRARLRKYVETEQVTETVPVAKERAVVEREPITDANVGAAKDGPAISEEEHEVVLEEERAVVGKSTTPVERVRLDKTTEVEQQQVTEDVRKEQITVDGDVDTPRS
jgi:uncharacterized protein (TIGR02271 family)